MRLKDKLYGGDLEARTRKKTPAPRGIKKLDSLCSIFYDRHKLSLSRYLMRLWY